MYDSNRLIRLCGMGCTSLSLLVKVWVLLKLQSYFVPWLVDWWFCCGDGLGVEDFGCHYWLQVVIWEASQSNCCLCLDEGWHLEEDNECFSRCHCSCQMLLGIYTPCARVLFSSLDVCSHFSPVIAWSCCQPGWPIKRWKCQLRSLAQAQSGISERLLQDW